MKDDSKRWQELDARLRAALRPTATPVAISFLEPGESSGAPALTGELAEPNERRRSGRVPAGCVFWVLGGDRSFATTAEDHANCSVGSYTHGFLSLEEASTMDDVEAVLAAGWVDEAAFHALPAVARRPDRIVYGPLATCARAPDVVLLRVNGLGMMSLRNALPDLAIEGKPQCHIVPLALERGIAAASVGCALSRARTGMRADEMTAALPGASLDAVVAALEATVALDRAMARYAANDAKRFE